VQVAVGFEVEVVAKYARYTEGGGHVEMQRYGKERGREKGGAELLARCTGHC